MKTNLIGLALAAVSLTSFAAFADDWDDDDGNDNGVQVSVGWNQNAPCDYDHEAVPVFINQAPPPRADGRYEQRSSQRWIPARYEQVTVQQCVEHHRHGGWKQNRSETQCFPVTQTRLVPGYYQTVQEWVFVPYPPPPQQYSQYPGHRPPMFGQVGFTFGTR